MNRLVSAVWRAASLCRAARWMALVVASVAGLGTGLAGPSRDMLIKRAAPPEDSTRRKAERVRDERHAAPLMLFFRAESIFSWGEFTKVQRADDDSDDGNALEAARDMDVLSIAEDPGNASRLAARVRFDLDLPSAAADDMALGPGEHLPEWDWKAGALRPAHCAVQCRVARDTAPFTPDAQLRTTVRQVRRRLEVLRAAPARAHAQAQGAV
eukprot:gene42380-51758_t